MPFTDQSHLCIITADLFGSKIGPRGIQSGGPDQVETIGDKKIWGYAHSTATVQLRISVTSKASDASRGFLACQGRRMSPKESVEVASRLFREHGATIRSMVGGYGLTEQDADDIYQDIFLSVVANPPSHETSLRAT